MMDKVAAVLMFVNFAMSQEVLKFEPASNVSEWKKPDFCNGLDCPLFKVVKTTKEYEVRRYAASNWVATNLQDVEYKSASYTMFMRLFKYISGANDAKKKIPMTCPVTNNIIPGKGPACESNFTMAFYVPPTKGRTPKPTDKTVYLDAVPEFTAYVRQFSGFAMSYPVWQKEALALGEALQKDGVSDYDTQNYFTAGYDAPFKLFNRHNEVWFIQK